MGQSLRTRFRVPHVFVDGSTRPMEGRHRISALGGTGGLGIRRASLPVLSPRFLDPGRSARCCSALEDRAGRVLLDCAHVCRSSHVPARPRVAPCPRRVVCRRVLCAQSLPLVDRLLAECIRRTAGCATVAADAALSSAAPVRLSSYTVVESHAGRRLADERPRSPDDPLLSSRPRAPFGRS